MTMKENSNQSWGRPKVNKGHKWFTILICKACVCDELCGEWLEVSSVLTVDRMMSSLVSWAFLADTHPEDSLFFDYSVGSQQGHIRRSVVLSSACLLHFTSAAAAGSPKVSNYVRGLEPFYCFFSKTELLTIQFWLWFWTNNGAVIWAVSVCDCCQNDWEWRPPPASLQQPTPCSSLRHRKKNGGFQQSESYCSNN